MADAKHTPGPWRVSGVSMQTGNVSISMDAHRIVIAEVTNAASFSDMLVGAMKRGGGSFDQDDCHTQMANARLIAAAPDMIEALRQMVANAEADGKEYRDCYKKAVAAIAKAEGRS